MSKIYLTGAINDWENPFKWHDELMDSEKYSEHEFVNPYTLNNFELGDDEIYDRPMEVIDPALEEIETCDGVFVRWEDDAFLVGSAMEIKHAWEHDIPIVIWYEGYRDNLQLWLEGIAVSHFEDRDKALKSLLLLTGEENIL